MEDLLKMKSIIRREYDLSGPSFFVLVSIKIKRFKTIKEIIDYKREENDLSEKELTILKVKIATSIKELVEKGLIIKEASQGDRRIQEIKITKKCNKILERITEADYG